MMNDKEMSVYEHIGELRKRLITVVIFFFFAVIIGFFAAEPMIVYLQEADEAKKLTMNAFRLTDPIKIYMEFAIIIAIVLILPVILYQLWAFISPGLYEKERKVTLSYIPISLFLFIGGVAFSYFVLFPFVIDFMGRIANRLNIHQVIGINEYFQFLFQLTIPFGLLFQLPVVVMFLTRLGIITPMLLGKIRKYAYFLLLVVSAFITPPEVMSCLIVTIPLFGLYEISIGISKITYKRRMKAEQQLEESLEASL